MDVNSRLKKLLEIATHPTASDGERINALNAFRKISDKAGGLENVFGNATNLEVYEDFDRLRRAFQALQSENSRLKIERDALLLHTEALSKHVSTSKSAPSKGSENVILSALSKDWQELHRIHEKAKMVGYSETSAATLSHLEALCSSGKVTRREPGLYAGPHGKKVQQAQTWRLKTKFGL